MKTLKVKGWNNVYENYTGIVEFPNGEKHWLINREYHRLDGPAIECSNGRKQWCLNGKEFTKQEYYNHPLITKHKLDKLLELSL